MRHAKHFQWRLSSGFLAASAALSPLVSAVTPARSQSVLTAAARTVKVAHQREGDRLLRAGNIKAAARSYRRAATDAPKETLYQITSGVALASAGSTNEALAAFRRADKLAQGGDVLTALLLQGALSERADGAAEAQKLYARTVKRFSRSGVTGLDTTASVLRLLRAQKQYPQSPIIVLLLGDAYQLANQWTKAEASYRQAIQLAPTWVKPRINQGLCRLAQGHSADAISAFQGALALDPANTQAQIAKADAQLESGHVDDAVATYKKVENSPNNKVAAQAATGIGQAYAQRGQVADAVKSLNRAQQLTPADPTPSVALGAVQSRAGNYSEAAKAYTEALNLSGGGLFVSKGILYRALAETQLSAKDTSGAIATLRRAIADEPASKPLWYRLWSQALYQSGDTSGGAAKLQQAQELEKNAAPQKPLQSPSSR